ncbi:MAG: hypothetical protein U1C46_03555 [Bacteroidales bacterium]|nr:hypothetical protein [Bacteroidales bacterium]MDZ4203876.1 hypothetical protein [Bacteroidales bacterium]
MKFVLIGLAMMLSFHLTAQNNTRRLNRHKENHQAHGRWIYYYGDSVGKIQCAGRYKNGIPVGRWMTYYEDGSKYVRTRHFKERAREVRFHPNGKLEKKGWSKLMLDDPSGIRYYWHGKWKLYDENGKLYRIVLFSEGRVIDVIKNLDPEKEGIEMTK